ncbi:MAG TPA: hypothetical protein VIJ62_04750 [Rhizomicrobium sp.]
MFLKRALLGSLFACSLFTAADASTWTLHLSGIDDSMGVYVNGSLVSTCNVGKTCSVNLNNFLVSGPNTLKLILTNKTSGWTFDYKLLKDGVNVLSAKCGTLNVTGCLGNQFDLGKVYQVQVNILN